MKPSDKDALVFIEPESIERYLRATAWVLQKSPSDRFSVWMLKRRGRRFEVMVPSHSEFSDYPLRVSELLEVLEEVEGRGQVDILRDLRAALGAVITLRAGEDQGETSISLRDGIALARAGLELVAAAAHAAAAQVVPTELRARAVEAFVADVQLAPTESGSFVMPLVLPDRVSVPLGQPGTEIAGRLVKRHLETLLDDVETYSHQFADSHRPPHWGPIELLTAHALAELGEVTHVTRLSVELDPFFAADQVQAIARRTFLFDAAALGRLQKIPSAARVSRRGQVSAPREVAQVEETWWPDVQLTGLVTRLERPNVTLRAEVEGRTRNVRVRPPTEDDYDRGIEAHRRDVPVICAGELVRTRAGYRLENVYLFELAE